MSYTPPAGDAANFSWAGQDAYTAPAGSAANFSWLPENPVYIKHWNGATWDVGLLKQRSGSAWVVVVSSQLVTSGGRATVLPPA